MIERLKSKIQWRYFDVKLRTGLFFVEEGKSMRNFVIANFDIIFFIDVE